VPDRGISRSRRAAARAHFIAEIMTGLPGKRGGKKTIIAEEEGRRRRGRRGRDRRREGRKEERRKREGPEAKTDVNVAARRSWIVLDAAGYVGEV